MIKLRIISGLLILTSAFALRAADIPTAPAPGQIVLTFNKEEIGKPIPQKPAAPRAASCFSPIWTPKKPAS
jgi:hypothetical protein